MTGSARPLAATGAAGSAILRLLDHPRFVLLCFGLFMLPRLLILLVPVEMTSDAGWYLARGAGIASGDGYSEGGHPTAFWPVGYPGFLGMLFRITGPSQTAGALANLALAAGTFFLVLALQRHLFGNERAARLAVLLLAVYPNNIAYTPLLLTEIYFTFLMLLGSYLFVVRRSLPWLLLAGLAFGLMALTKPQAVVVPAMLGALWLFAPDGKAARWNVIRRTAAVYAVMAAVLVPWAIRNTMAFGEPVLISTNGGITLLTGNNGSARGGYTDRDPLVAQRHFSVADQVAADREARRLAIQWITANPDRFIALMPLKIFRAWGSDGEAEWAWQAGFPRYTRHEGLFRSVRIVNQAYYVLLMLGFAAATVALWRHRHETAWPWPLFGHLLCLYLTLIAMVFSGQSRFHFPAMPWVIMTVSWAAVFLQERRAGRNTAETRVRVP